MLLVVTANAGSVKNKSANPHTQERPGILHLPFAEEIRLKRYSTGRENARPGGAGWPQGLFRRVVPRIALREAQRQVSLSQGRDRASSVGKPAESAARWHDRSSRRLKFDALQSLDVGAVLCAGPVLLQLN